MASCCNRRTRQKQLWDETRNIFTSPGLWPSRCALSDGGWIFPPCLDRFVQGQSWIVADDWAGGWYRPIRTGISGPGWALSGSGVIFESGFGDLSRLMWVIAGAGEWSVLICSPALSAWTNMQFYFIWAVNIRACGRCRYNADFFGRGQGVWAGTVSSSLNRSGVADCFPSNWFRHVLVRVLFCVQQGVTVWIKTGDEFPTVVVFSVWIEQGAALTVWSLHVWACLHVQVCKTQNYSVEQETHTHTHSPNNHLFWGCFVALIFIGHMLVWQWGLILFLFFRDNFRILSVVSLRKFQGFCRIRDYNVGDPSLF